MVVAHGSGAWSIRGGPLLSMEGPEVNFPGDCVHISITLLARFQRPSYA